LTTPSATKSTGTVGYGDCRAGEREATLPGHPLRRHMIGRAVLDYTVNERVQTRMGNALREYAPTGVYPCAGTDCWVALAAPTDDAWRALCRASGQGWADDSRFATAIARGENREALDAAIGAWTAGFEPGRDRPLRNRNRQGALPARSACRSTRFRDDEPPAQWPGSGSR
jgi:CoA-transferase family III